MAKKEKTKIEEYVEAKRNLDVAKRVEAKLRLEITDTFTQGIGTHTREIGRYEVKAVFRNSFNIDPKMLSSVEDKLSAEEFLCINYKPTLRLSEYKQLDEEERTTLDECVIVKPSMPSLKVMLIEED